MSSSEWTPELEQWLKREALANGFALAGIAPVSQPGSSANQLTAAYFNAWIEAGRAGEMDYLKRRNEDGTLLRSDIQVAFPWARSIIICAFNYNARAPHSIDPAPEDAGWIARYAWSGRDEQWEGGSGQSAQPDTEPDQKLLPTDYHDQLLSRLQHLESALQHRQPCQARCYVDTGPLIERAAAAIAGIGWIGKNTCVINQQFGSWLLLGVIVTSLSVGVSLTIEPAADRCGSCTRCIDACPTDALVAPRQMDASRCIAYLTIEKKGSIPEDLRPLMGRQVFGCDICQEVCPWNDESPRGRKPIALSRDMLPRPELINPQLGWLAGMDAAAFRHHFKGSPVERTRRKRLLRNVAIGMGNSGQQIFLPTLENWAAAQDGDPVLVEAARWAIQQLGRKTDRTETPSEALC